MTDWKEEYIAEINASKKLNDKKKKDMIKVIQKSQDNSKESFFLRVETIFKFYHIHKNYHKYDTYENRNAQMND